MQNDANCCDMSLYIVLFGVGWVCYVGVGWVMQGWGGDVGWDGSYRGGVGDVGVGWGGSCRVGWGGSCRGGVGGGVGHVGWGMSVG